MNRLLKSKNFAFILGSRGDECMCFLCWFLPSPSVQGPGMDLALARHLPNMHTRWELG